jgi:hypothetical protein
VLLVTPTLLKLKLCEKVDMLGLELERDMEYTLIEELVYSYLLSVLG